MAVLQIHKVTIIQTGWCTGDRARKIITHTQHVSPDLVLQEVHVAVKQSVGGRQNSHRLHPRSTLQLALHRHVRKTGQPEVAAFTEISNPGAKQRRGVNTEWQISGRDWTDLCFLYKMKISRFSMSGRTYMKSLVMRWEPLAIDLNSTPSRLM